MWLTTTDDCACDDGSRVVVQSFGGRRDAKRGSKAGSVVSEEETVKEEES